MKQYIKPEITVIELSLQDIVITSNGLDGTNPQDTDSDIFNWEY